MINKKLLKDDLILWAFSMIEFFRTGFLIVPDDPKANS